ncbi:DNA-binding protein [Marichromatium sp. AB31]|nr:DNA-binding protein [Marichromatium sp. AB31]
MRTLDLHEAAEFLRMHPETLRRRAVAGEIPSAKPGKCWVFIEADLVDWLRSRYDVRARAPGEENRCSTNAQIVPFGGSASRHQTAKEYAALLERKTRAPRRSTRQS